LRIANWKNRGQQPNFLAGPRGEAERPGNSVAVPDFSDFPRLAAYVIAAAVLIVALAGTARGQSFVSQVLPGDRQYERIAWQDVDGDGRKDYIRQAERWLEVYFLDAQHHVGATPSWRVTIPAPWDLWDFADVKPDLPGEELLLLSPKGLGFLSFAKAKGTQGSKGTERTKGTGEVGGARGAGEITTNAAPELLIDEALPLIADAELAVRGRIAIDLNGDNRPELLLPSQRGIRIYGRAADGAQWRLIEEIEAPARPSPMFGGAASQPYLVGFGEGPLVRGLREGVPERPAGVNWMQYWLRSTWSASPGRLLDWNGDGRLDLVDWKPSGPARGLRIFPQTPEGRFDRAHPITPRWPVILAEKEKNTRDRDAGTPPPEFARRADPGDLRVENLADVNGDKRLDLVRIAADDNWAAPKTRIAVYLQRADGSFSDRPDSVVRHGAVVPVADLPMADVDGDGDLDLLLLRIDLEVASVGSHVKTFFRQGLQTHLGAYLWQPGQGHASRPVWEKTITISHEMFDFSRDPHPAMEFDRDLTGDGRPDLVLRTGRSTIGVFPLNPKTGYSEAPLASLELPFPIESVDCADFDGDGRIDISVNGWDPEDREKWPRAIFFNTVF
jgi:hypothetical protein